MTYASARVGLALACATLVAGQALANGYKSGPGLKGAYRDHHAKPVPAPVPIPEYEPLYYVGLSLGYSAFSSGNYDSSFTDGGSALTGQQPFLLEDPSDIEGPWNFGVQMGRYLSRHLRVELSIDVRNEHRIGQDDAGSVTLTEGGDTHTYDYTRGNRTRLGYHTAVAKLIYDFEKRYGVRPFIGAGAGITLYSIDHDTSVRYNCTDSSTGSCANAPELDSSASEGPDVSYGFALLVLTGLSFDIGNDKKLDLGYQGVWTSGTATSMARDSASSNSKFKIKDRFDHEVRVGLRWDLR
ncbi:MAG: hypothetical protein AAF732_12385 [Pseudomonadota bacterium]